MIHSRRMKLPKYVVLKSMYNNKYLSYRDEKGEDQHGFLQFSEEDDPMSRYSKFEVKASTTEKGLVHLRCCFNKKYLARESPSSWWISGSGAKIQEDRSEWSCTLFKPVLVNGDYDGELIVVRFLHVQLNHYACLFRSGPPYGDCLYAGWESPNQDLCDACSVIDWESLRETRVPKRANYANNVLPKFVVIKSRYNHKYLRYRSERGEQHGFLQFSLEDDKASAVANQYTKFEVRKARSGDGLVHLKCCYNNKYLVRSSATKWWISATANNVEEDASKWSCTLFKPVYVNNEGGGATRMVRFWHVQLQHYACLFRSGPPFGECLYAGWKDPNQDLCDVCTIIDWEKEQQDEDVTRDQSGSEEEDEVVSPPRMPRVSTPPRWGGHSGRLSPRRGGHRGSLSPRRGGHLGSLSPIRHGGRDKTNMRNSDNEYYTRPRHPRHQDGKKINSDDEDNTHRRHPQRGSGHSISPASRRHHQDGKKTDHDDEYNTRPRHPPQHAGGRARSPTSTRHHQDGKKTDHDDEYNTHPRHPSQHAGGRARSPSSTRHHQDGKKTDHDDEYNTRPRHPSQHAGGHARSSSSTRHHQDGKKTDHDDEYNTRPRHPAQHAGGRSTSPSRHHQDGRKTNHDDEDNTRPRRPQQAAGGRSTSPSRNHQDGRKTNRDDEDNTRPRHPQHAGGRSTSPSRHNQDGRKTNRNDEDNTRPRHPQRAGGSLSPERPDNRKQNNKPNSDNEEYTRHGNQQTHDAKGKPYTYDIPKQEPDKHERYIAKYSIRSITHTKITVGSHLLPHSCADTSTCSDEVEFNVISSADTFWGAVFVSTKLLPKALSHIYKDIKVISGDGFSEGSIREISFTQGLVGTFKERIVYVDHETKTIKWSLLEGGMLNQYERFKITISVAPKKRRDRGSRVKWSYVGTNPKQKFNKEEFKKLFQKTFEAVDDYLENNAARDTN
ncbi:MLP-like protein 423 [Linum perenne]